LKWVIYSILLTLISTDSIFTGKTVLINLSFFKPLKFSRLFYMMLLVPFLDMIKIHFIVSYISIFYQGYHLCLSFQFHVQNFSSPLIYFFLQFIIYYWLEFVADWFWNFFSRPYSNSNFLLHLNMLKWLKNL
jgi:hypothetical protein